MKALLLLVQLLVCCVSNAEELCCWLINTRRT